MTAALEVIDTGEVIEQMTTEEASSITTQISVKLDAIADNYQAVMPLIRDAITRQAHVALGYLSAGAYVADRFGSALSRLGVDTRRQVVKELSEAGMSTRAIAPVVGTTNMTVHRDLAGVTNVTTDDPEPPDDDLDADPPLTQTECEALDESGMTDSELARQAEQMEAESRPTVIGRDGKTYKPTAPRKPNRKALPDVARDVGWDLTKAVEKLQRVCADDRFTTNKDAVATQLRSHLTNAIEVCQDLRDRIDN